MHRRGHRFRVQFTAPEVPRRSMDIAFTRAKVAVFLDGCFWHACPLHATQPKTNMSWWRSKLDANRLRDSDTSQRLQDLGWTVVRIWEHVPELEAIAMIENALDRVETHLPCSSQDRRDSDHWPR
jgi:DNA mismatch endonuclease (patch repair protein)